MSGPTTATVGVAVTFIATVHASTGTPAGTVQFAVDGVPYGPPLPVHTAATTGISYVPTDTDPHTITAVFAPSTTSAYAASADRIGVTVIAAAAPTDPTGPSDPSGPPDPQTVVVDVPPGALVISSPYTPTHPLDLGTLRLDPSGAFLETAPVPFGDAADPSGGITITDTRANSGGWAASVQAGDFAGGGHGFTGDGLVFDAVTPNYVTGNRLQAPAVVTDDLTHLGTPGTFASTRQGPGTVMITGRLSLQHVPTSVLPGEYSATITFTVI